MDSLFHVEEPRGELLSSIVINPGMADSVVEFPETNDNKNGAAPVAQIYILVKAQPGPWKWESISLQPVLKLVKQSFNDSEHIAGAVEHYFTASFPSSPSDGEMEKHLRGFYFRIVKPYVLPS